jgi:hypothetical protein
MQCKFENGVATIWVNVRWHFAIEVCGPRGRDWMVFVKEPLAFGGFVNRLREAVNELRRRGWRLKEENLQQLLGQAKGVAEMLEAAEHHRTREAELRGENRGNCF